MQVLLYNICGFNKVSRRWQ